MTNNPLVTGGAKQPDLLNQTQKPAATPPKRGRLTFVMDATASRQPTWDMAAKLQAGMFHAASNFGGLSMQLIYFRGLDECQASRWVTDAAALEKLMSSITCQMGATQIGRALRYIREQAAKSQKTNAVIYVGDAMEEDRGTLIDLATQLGKLQIPLFMFQEGTDPHVSDTFDSMALASGGAFASFNSTAADRLSSLLGAVAAYASGGRAALLDYEKKQKELGKPVFLLSDQVKK